MCEKETFVIVNNFEKEKHENTFDFDDFCHAYLLLNV